MPRAAGPLPDLVFAADSGFLRVKETMMAKSSKPRSLQLGRTTRLPEKPERAVLDRVPNPHADTDYVARFTAPEFTALCPITSAPTCDGLAPNVKRIASSRVRSATDHENNP